jgi:hypothetical protein
MLKKFKMEEIWKDIPDYEGLYQASNLGRVKSLPKEWTMQNGVTQRHNGKILKPSQCKGMYKLVVLYKKSSSKTYRVHQLVAIAFLNHKICGHKLVVDHINNNPYDNRVENLQIVTQRYNCRKTQGEYSSQYKGVYWHKERKKWHSVMLMNGKRKHLGYFTDEHEAHLAYQNALKQIENERLD